ncbi:uncharacterized protein MEPE_04470 [Melanopsichium pennsylvanicum]|uniref:Large ribosomal subunit protein uL23m n=2 Tax=Melanopsichium pennsylvanicum TaxID=63383 RepID=A0AAJ4XPV6_9BASI|nr:conserved hypothetical protein [Melanopsichium pennsylvanicum 4]SNX85761.1 uncharacterized protein MEPE_04470 [Melanopsichium pennsylvanicum]
MISAPASQALLARSALRSARMTRKVARVAPAVLISSSASQPSRSLTVSSISRNNAKIIATNIVNSTSDTSVDALRFADQPLVITTQGRKNKRNKSPSTEMDKAKLLLKWGWFDCTHQKQLALSAALSAARRMPEWVSSIYELAKSFRSARARLWTPTLQEIRSSLSESESAEITDVQTWIQRQLRIAKEAKEPIVNDSMDYERQLDYVLRPIWQAMSQQHRDAALLRTRFDCIRKLGWRQGYSSGYPRPEGEQSHFPDKLGAKGDQGWAAFKKLQKAEAEQAWDVWQKLSSQERVAEEKAAWKLRDRSHIYLDDSYDCFILGSSSPRWYPTPERAGELTFLPNITVKLVKNYTPQGQEYDAFKATFRVPLSMHKHALRSYLLSIYGLKTTWARSSIYRSSNTRDNRTGMKITGRGRTFKKVEVGLLEPFLFPEVSPEFQKQHLLTSELDYERSRVYLKMTKTTRWRGKKSTEQYEQEIANRDNALFHNLDPLGSEGIKGNDKEVGEKFPRFMVKTKGLPSAKHGKILQLLSQERKVKEKRVEELVAQFKRDAAAAAAAAQ